MQDTVHRSPHTFEIVDPEDALVDRRNLPENVAKRVAGHKSNTNCGADQLFENNVLLDEEVTSAEATDPDRLFQASAVNPPNFAILTEKPEHRIIVYLKAQGLSNKEVAEKTGYTQSWVCQIVRQPWFRLRLVQELKEAGVDAVHEVLKGSVLDSVFTLIEIRDDPTTPKAVRSQNCERILDRFFGKPTQRVESDDKRMPSSPEIAQLNTELEQINQQLNHSPDSSESCEVTQQEL